MKGKKQSSFKFANFPFFKQYSFFAVKYQINLLKRLEMVLIKVQWISFNNHFKNLSLLLLIFLLIL